MDESDADAQVALKNLPPQRPGLVSVVIVNFNAGSVLTDCVRRVLASSIDTEVIVVDNASRDDSLELLRNTVQADARLRIIQNVSNLGFAAACNIGILRAAGEYVLLLNPDCLVQAGTLAAMRDVMDKRPEVGMAGCLIRNPDGSEQVGCRRSVPTPWRSAVRVLKLSSLFPDRFRSFDLKEQPLPAEPVSIEAISGAFMFVRRRAMEEVGLLDPAYFMHCEDLDWCMRFRQAGHTILFVPGVEVVHFKGVSTARRPIRVEWYKHRGMIRFYRKFFWDTYPAALRMLVIPSVLARFCLKALHMLLLRVLQRSGEDGIAAAAAAGAGSARIDQPGALVIGGRSQVGQYLLPRLAAAGYRVVAFTRGERSGRHAGAHPAGAGGAAARCPETPGNAIAWRRLGTEAGQRLLAGVLPGEQASVLIHLAPIPSLVGLVDEAARRGVRRIIAFSSTSRFTKLDSDNTAERHLARTLAEAEQSVAERCESLGIAWTVFRPTLVYGGGRGGSVMMIARFARRFRFFPILGEGFGRRQPVHADDLAAACMNALSCPASYNRAYNLSGGETLTYRQMVEAIFRAIHMKPRIVSVRPELFRAALPIAQMVPRYRELNMQMVMRMDRDLCFDHGEAVRDFGFHPRRFEMSEDAV